MSYEIWKRLIKIRKKEVTMATISFDRKIEIKEKKAVNRFYEALTSPSKKTAPKYDAEKEIKKGVQALKQAFCH